MSLANLGDASESYRQIGVGRQVSVVVVVGHGYLLCGVALLSVSDGAESRGLTAQVAPRVEERTAVDHEGVARVSAQGQVAVKIVGLALSPAGVYVSSWLRSRALNRDGTVGL
jgi:hypothetical protein